MNGRKLVGLRGLVSAEATSRFLQDYYGLALDASPAALALFTLPGAKTFASRDITTLAKHAIDCASKRRNVYFHIHLHSLAEGVDRVHRGSIESVAAAVGSFADIDAQGPGRHKPPETLCPTARDALYVALEFNRTYAPLRTAFTILSAHGCYPAILFREPMLVVDSKSRLLLEKLSRRFHLALHRIAAKHGWTGAVEYCDPAKVLRLPGTANWKDVMRPKPVKLVEEDAARFNPSELDEWLPPLAENKPHSTTSAIDAGGDASIVLRVGARISDQVLRALCELHPRFADTWNHRRNDLRDESCSAYDLALANICVRCGFTDQQIADLLVMHRKQFPGKRKNRRGASYVKYLSRQIGLARAGRLSSDAAAAEHERFNAVLHGSTFASTDIAPEDEAMEEEDCESS